MRIRRQHRRQPATLVAETRLLGPDEYAAYLKNQNQLFTLGIKAIN